MIRPASPFLLAFILPGLLLGGCMPEDTTFTTTVCPVTGEHWWDGFEEPQLYDLMNMLGAGNIDIKTARARLDEAKALAHLARAGQSADLSAIATASRDGVNSPSPENLLRTGVQATWDTDLSGRNQATTDAAHLRVSATQYSLSDIQRVMIAELVLAMIDLRSAQETITTTRSLLAAQQDQIDVFSLRAENGLIDASVPERARAQHMQTATQLPLAEASARQAQYRIERLLGQTPGSLSARLAPAPGTGLRVPQPTKTLEIPLETIKGRPDLVAAELNRDAAAADLRAAEADLWPKITLSAFFGVQETSDGLSVLSAPNPIWSIASNLVAPVFHFERLHAVIEARDARLRTAALNYEGAVLNALQEAHTALSDYLNGVNAITRQTSALHHRQQTVALARVRFERGLNDMTDLTTAQSELDQASLALIARKADTARAWIRLQRALGAF